jgi:hypothetical protein
MSKKPAPFAVRYNAGSFGTVTLSQHRHPALALAAYYRARYRWPHLPTWIEMDGETVSPSTVAKTHNIE